MSESDRETNLRMNLARMGVIAGGLQDFAAQLIAHASSGSTLDDGTLASIRTSCIQNLKNMDASGPSLEQQARFIGRAIEEFEKLVDEAIRRGRHP